MPRGRRICLEQRKAVWIRTMECNARTRLSHIIGPDGSVLTTNDLPLPYIERWLPRKKAEVVVGVRGGLLSLDDACTRYGLTAEEFFSWQSALERFGIRGLRVTNRRGAYGGRQRQ
jgi:hypothetical protein